MEKANCLGHCPVLGLCRPLFRSRTLLHPGEGEAGLTAQGRCVLTDSPTTTHRNLTSGSLNDISDKPEKEQVSQAGHLSVEVVGICFLFALVFLYCCL